MPIVRFQGEEIECKEGERLRDVLLRAGRSPHNGRARWINCKGMGTCGTCAVAIVEGEPGPRSGREKWRLNFPPHHEEDGLRLACQVKVWEDLSAEKHEGFWGHKVVKSEG